MTLVLSLFPGGGLLDHAFELEGFTVVRGPDVLWGGDVRRFHPPAGRFDGIIGGDPCQSHSSLANLVRARGLKPSFPDLTEDYQRVFEEARPAWFLRENVPKAPDIAPDGYDVRSFMLCNSTLDSGDGWGNEQMRKRRWWFGVREGECPELRAFIDFALFELPDAVPTVQGGCTGGVQGEALKRRQSSVTQTEVNNDPAIKAPGARQRQVRGDDRETRDRPRMRQQAVAGDARSVPVALGGSGRRKVTADGGHDGTADAIAGYRKARDRAKTAPVTGRHEGAVGSPEIDYSPPRRSLEEMLHLQGLPADFWGDEGQHCPFKMSALRKMAGNGVPVPMGRALAKAIRQAMREAA